MDITKQAIKEALGLKTDADVARLLGTTRQNVHAWGDKPLPLNRQWQVQALLPSKFPRKAAL
jgi:hypothetical protein